MSETDGIERKRLAERIAARRFSSRRRLYARFIAHGHLSRDDRDEAEAQAHLLASRINLRKLLCGDR